MSDLKSGYRTHASRDIVEVDGEEVTLAGRVHALIDESTVELRDGWGRVRATVAGDAPGYVAEQFTKLGLEDVVQLGGTVIARDEEDPDHPTGAVELQVRKLEPLCRSAPPPPWLHDEEAEVPLSDRLACRQLYLRQPAVRERMRLRARARRAAREYLLEQRFLEIETPHLFWYDAVATDPEPVPVEDGKAFALPSGPVVLNQYIKPGNFDRFFQFLQITRREDDPTPAHQPEFTGLDLNMAYVDVDEFQALVEGLVKHLAEVLSVELEPFEKLSHKQAMDRYGSDKPDPRGGVEVRDLTEQGPEGRCVFGFVLEGQARQMRGELSDADFGADDADFLWARIITRRSMRGSAKELLDEHPKLKDALGAGKGDVVVLATSEREAAARGCAEQAANRLAQDLGLGNMDTIHPMWIHTYPFMGWDAEVEDHVPQVVVFSRPVDDDEDLRIIVEEPERRNEVRSRAFDLVINGLEVASGYIGNYDLELQRLIWDHLFQQQNADLVRLRAPIEAHRFGVPPHGGMVIGWDRLIAALLGRQAIDEVMPYPKTGDGRHPLMAAPGSVPAEAVGDMVAEAEEPDYGPENLVEEVLSA